MPEDETVRSGAPVALGVVVLGGTGMRSAVALRVVLVMGTRMCSAVTQDVVVVSIALHHVVSSSPGSHRLRTDCPAPVSLSVVRPTCGVSSSRQLLSAAGEARQSRLVADQHPPVADAYPATSFESAQRRVDALPRGPDVMRQILLAHRQLLAVIGRRRELDQ